MRVTGVVMSFKNSKMIASYGILTKKIREKISAQDDI